MSETSNAVIVVSSRYTKEYHRITNLKSLSIQYSEVYNDFIISFIEFGKRKVISLKRFDITGYTTKELHDYGKSKK